VLTADKIEVYRRFNGDGDGFSRAEFSQRTSDITDADWSAIDELRQALFIIANGMASPEFAVSVEKRMANITADDRARQALRELASPSMPPV
jgi:hypothetical protein